MFHFFVLVQLINFCFAGPGSTSTTTTTLPPADLNSIFYNNCYYFTASLSNPYTWNSGCDTLENNYYNWDLICPLCEVAPANEDSQHVAFHAPWLTDVLVVNYPSQSGIAKETWYHTSQWNAHNPACTGFYVIKINGSYIGNECNTRVLMRYCNNIETSTTQTPEFSTTDMLSSTNTNEPYTTNEIEKDNLDLNIIMNRLDNNYQLLINEIPNHYTFTYDECFNYPYGSINDGGEDMFDCGNILNTNLGSYIYYSNNTISNESYYLDYEKYFTLSLNGIFIFASNLNSKVNSFIINGNLGADGMGNVLAYEMMILNYYNFKIYRVFVKIVYGANDPSIAQIIIVENNNENVYQSVSYNTDNNYHSINNLQKNNRLYYLLISSIQGKIIPSWDIQRVVDTFFDIIYNDHIITPSPYEPTSTSYTSTETESTTINPTSTMSIFTQTCQLETLAPTNIPTNKPTLNGNSKNNKYNIGVIIGAALGSLFGLLIVGFIIGYWCYRNKKTRQGLSKNVTSFHENDIQNNNDKKETADVVQI